MSWSSRGRGGGVSRSGGGEGGVNRFEARRREMTRDLEILREAETGMGDLEEAEDAEVA